MLGAETAASNPTPSEVCIKLSTQHGGVGRGGEGGGQGFGVFVQMEGPLAAFLCIPYHEATGFVPGKLNRGSGQDSI